MTFPATMIGKGGLVGAIFLVLNCAAAWADTKIEPRGSRFAGALPEVQATLTKNGIDLRPVSLGKALAHPDPFVRGQALMALAAYGTPAEVPMMKRLLFDRNFGTRILAVYALDDVRKRTAESECGVTKAELATAAKKTLADARSTSDQIYAAKALVEVGDDPSGYPVVLSALKGQNVAKRAYACAMAPPFTTRLIRDSNGNEIDWVTPLVAIVQDTSDAEVSRSAAISVLCRIDSPQAKAALNGLAKSVNNPHLRSIITSLLASPKMSGDAESPVFRGDG